MIGLLCSTSNLRLYTQRFAEVKTVFQSGHLLVPHACGKRRDIFKGGRGIEARQEFSGQGVKIRVTTVTNVMETVL
jgi:hypothetical protein